MNPCFMCLDPTQDQICPRCNCSAHPACFESYKTSCKTFKCPYLGHLSYSCPVCKFYIADQEERELRKYEKETNDAIKKRIGEIFERQNLLQDLLISYKNQENNGRFEEQEGVKHLLQLPPPLVLEKKTDEIKKNLEKEDEVVRNFEQLAEHIVRIANS